MCCPESYIGSLDATLEPLNFWMSNYTIYLVMRYQLHFEKLLLNVLEVSLIGHFAMITIIYELWLSWLYHCNWQNPNCSVLCLSPTLHSVLSFASVCLCFKWRKKVNILKMYQYLSSYWYHLPSFLRYHLLGE